MSRALLLASVFLPLLPVQALADPKPETLATTSSDESDPARSAPQEQGPNIIVSAPYSQSEQDVLSGTSVVTGEELTRNLRPTIGETLARQPGVSASSFGPSASRPILRGFQGERVRILTDGIGSIDVSNTSADHAVIIDPLLAERVEVLRGPSALLFGSSAMGGVVNVIDSRIPRSVPEKGYRLNGIATYGSAASERSVGGAGDVALGNRIVLHADGSYTKSDDLKIGGYALSAAKRREALASAALPADPDAEEPIDFAANARIRGTLPNSASETWTAGAGASLITETGMLGLAYSHYDSLYGIPVRYATQPGQGQEAPRLSVVQNRVDLRAEAETGGGFLQNVRFRAGYAAYRHFELEEDGAVGTAFYNKGLEGRLELIQSEKGAWRGASGVQYFSRNFDVQGDEAFLPKNQTSQLGLFTLQQLDFGKLKAEAGVRYEFTDLSADTVLDDARFFRGKRHFQALSGSIGASYGLSDTVRIGLNGSHTERAPSAEELFANGAHAGTEAYELGDPGFRLEKSWGLEATLHAHGDGFSFDASAYYNWFSNYISDNQTTQAVCQAAAAPSGRTVDLPCFQFTQRDARYYGFEAEGSVRLAQIGGYRINLDALGDYVHANIVDQGPAPRIPAMRVLGGIEAQSDLLTGRLEAEHVFKQDRIAAFETPTAAYTMVNATVSVKPFRTMPGTTLMVSANNLFDVEARRAASYLKDFAPLAGRDIRVTLRLSL